MQGVRPGTGNDSSQLEAALKEAPPQVARTLIQFVQGQSKMLYSTSTNWSSSQPMQRKTKSGPTSACLCRG